LSGGVSKANSRPARREPVQAAAAGKAKRSAPAKRRAPDSVPADPELTDRAVTAADGGEALGPVRLRDLATAGVRAVSHSGTVRGSGRLARESVRILRGSSEIAPERGDWRFRDPTWKDNPAYRRLMQIHLAWAREVSEVVEGADLNWRDAERARFLATLITTTLAPTNSLPGNPEALKRILETGGRSLVRGARNYAGDLRHNGGMPSSVNAKAFTVGGNLAATPGAVVYRDEVCEVIQYKPQTPHVMARPVLMIPPQINKYYFMDLAPGRSFIEHAVAKGLQFFVISWRNPTSAQRDWDMDVYAAAVLHAIDVARDITRSDDVNTLSLCAGGILTTAVLSHLAAHDDPRVNSASFGVTLLDFDVPAPIGMFDSPPVISLGRFRSGRGGVLDGKSLAAVFTWLRPNDLVWNYWVNNYLLGNDPPTFDILAWNADSTNLPAALHRQFLEIFSGNALAEGTLTVLGTPVDLGRIELETYVTGATTDHLTPWRGCYRTTQLIQGDSTFILSNAGHIASLINPPGNPKAHYFAGPPPTEDPEQWLAGAKQQPGTWWQHWAEWVNTRAGEERKAPTRLGSRRHRPIEPAPGSYVRGVQPPAT
jgi:polyhydroxyalkanoate synthase